MAILTFDAAALNNSVELHLYHPLRLFNQEIRLLPLYLSLHNVLQQYIFISLHLQVLIIPFPRFKNTHQID